MVTVNRLSAKASLSEFTVQTSWNASLGKNTRLLSTGASVVYVPAPVLPDGVTHVSYSLNWPPENRCGSNESSRRPRCGASRRPDVRCRYEARRSRLFHARSAAVRLSPVGSTAFPMPSVLRAAFRSGGRSKRSQTSSRRPLHQRARAPSAIVQGVLASLPDDARFVEIVLAGERVFEQALMLVRREEVEHPEVARGAQPAISWRAAVRPAIESGARRRRRDRARGRLNAWLRRRDRG